MYVVDAFRNSLLFQESYHAEADWSYPEGQSVDTNNSLFWRGDFGRVALNTVNAAVSDITSIITCEATVTQVVDKLSGELVIGMGSADGVVVAAADHPARCGRLKGNWPSRFCAVHLLYGLRRGVWTGH